MQTPGKTVDVWAHAKINLFLGIVGEKGDGFHELAMIMQSISLADHITLTPTPQDLTLTCDWPELPTDSRNLAWRAAVLVKERFGIPQGLAIHLGKHIPVGAGLAGGSADAAAVLVGVNHLWGLGLTVPELCELGSQLGSDVPFCVAGGTMLATGRGEILDPLPDLHLALVIAKPKAVSVPTPWAYQTHRHLRHQHPDWQPRSIQPMLKALNEGHPVAIAGCLFNDLEWPVLNHYPEIAAAKTKLTGTGVLGTLMSGSGAAVFALVDQASTAQAYAHHWGSLYPDLDFWAVETVDHGTRLRISS